MTGLKSEQRYYYYHQESVRVGIDKAILIALYETQTKPPLSDHETGLGMSPVNQISNLSLNTFPQQVYYAANTIRSQIKSLIDAGWKAIDFWNSDKGCYSEKLLKQIASGYSPPPEDPKSALIEECKSEQLIKSYLKIIDSYQTHPNWPHNLHYLDQALLSFTERITEFYYGLPQQREAIIETARIWGNFFTRTEAITSLVSSPNYKTDELQTALTQFIQKLPSAYQGYPYQREALIQLVLIWRMLPNRLEAITSLQTNSSPEITAEILDSALIAFLSQIPYQYQGTATQRNNLTEFYRKWHKLDSRVEAISKLGFPPDLVTDIKNEPNGLATLAQQLDTSLLNFIKNIPILYQEENHQRESLLQLVRLWRGFGTRYQTIQSLYQDIKIMERLRKNSIEAPPKPTPLEFPEPPLNWTPENIQLYSPIIPNGQLIWANATHGGTRIPTDQMIIDGIIRIAKLAEMISDRLERPLLIVSWYRPSYINRAVGGASDSRHLIGDAIDFMCEGISGEQIYWYLDPWWIGGLGRYKKFPHLCHIDARGYRARWQY